MVYRFLTMLRRSLRLVISSTVLSLLPVIAVVGSENPDFELEAGNEFYLHLHSQLQPLVINQIHSWHLELSNGTEAVQGASIDLIGGMPEHDHGLPTQPKVTAEIRPGVYLIEGIRFHMPGAWQMLFSIEVNGQTTNVTLDFHL